MRNFSSVLATPLVVVVVIVVHLLSVVAPIVCKGFVIGCLFCGAVICFFV